MQKIVLASGSPRRKELLEKIGLNFLVDPSNYEEVLDQTIGPLELVKRLSFGKASDVAKRHPDSLIIGADSVVAVDNITLGKPHSKEKAIEMLSKLSGKTHSAISGFTIIDTKTGKTVSEAVETKIFFRKLNPDEIEKYVATGEPLDKAGAYAIQGKGALLVDKIEGDFYNIVGLPLGRVVKVLNNSFGVSIW
jgi:septum formation protein